MSDDPHRKFVGTIGGMDVYVDDRLGSNDIILFDPKQLVRIPLPDDYLTKLAEEAD